MRTRFLKKLAAFAAGLGLLGIGGFASASGLTSAQMSAIVSLLQSFGASDTAVANVEAALGGSASVSSVASPCPHAVLLHNLALGSTDAETNGDVSSLQRFLIAQGLLGAQATGYFGPLTRAALVQWQLSHGVPGVGAAGPLTRAAMEKCKGGATTATSTAVSFSASPASGAAPLAVAFSVGGILNGSDAYLINYGDGSSSSRLTAQCAGFMATVGGTGGIRCSLPVSSHTYRSAGTYTAMLENALPPCNSGAGICNMPAQIIYGTATITVTAAAPPNPLLPTY